MSWLTVLSFSINNETHKLYCERYSLQPSGIIFHFYMYGVAIIFIVYVNLFVIHPPWFNRILYYLADKGWWKNAEVLCFIPWCSISCIMGTSKTSACVVWASKRCKLDVWTLEWLRKSGKVFRRISEDKKNGAKSAGHVFPFGSVVPTFANSEKSQREDFFPSDHSEHYHFRGTFEDDERKEMNDLFTELHYHAGESQRGAREHTLLEDGNTS